MSGNVVVLLKWITVLFVLLYCAGANVSRVNATSRHLLEVRKRANFYRKHAVKSIQSEDGDIIDCIDIYKQSVFDHPALKNHKIQMSPTPEEAEDMKAVSNKSAVTMNEKLNMMLKAQVWRRNGSCPSGTIPMRRIRKRLLNKSKNGRYGTKGPSFPYQSNNLNDNSKDSKALYVNRSLAILHAETMNYNAAKSDIKVWNPYVEHDDEYTTSHLALKNGHYDNYESIESGWTVNPSVYGDRETRVYVYWTSDGSNVTGCFDLICPGFVQTTNEVAIGSVIRSIPVPGGVPWIMTVYIFKDPVTRNWWLQYQDDIYIGYWPAELFGALPVTAASVQWGGEVYSSRLGHPGHTKTEMGSGALATGDANSGWTKRMRVRDGSMLLKYPDYAFTLTDDYDCYAVFLNWEYMPDPEFYYGGPGKGWESWRCT